jgi:hypothetical protein
MGSTHPITKRTRDDVFIILEKLSREGVTASFIGADHLLISLFLDVLFAFFQEANTSAGSF